MKLTAEEARFLAPIAAAYPPGNGGKYYHNGRGYYHFLSTGETEGGCPAIHLAARRKCSPREALDTLQDVIPPFLYVLDTDPPAVGEKLLEYAENNP